MANTVPINFIEQTQKKEYSLNSNHFFRVSENNTPSLDIAIIKRQSKNSCN